MRGRHSDLRNALACVLNQVPRQHVGVNRSTRIGFPSIARAQFGAFGRNIPVLDQLAVSLYHVKGCLLPLAPEANVEHVLANAKIINGKVWQPGGKMWVDVEFAV